MQDTIDDQKLTKDFFRLQIEQRDNTYNKSFFDEINSRLIFEQLKEPDDLKDDLALVTPEDPTVLLMVVVESLLALLKYDVSSGSKTTLKDIKPGDSVGLIENRVMYPGQFLGKTVIHGKNYFSVKRLDNGMVESIPEGTGREWRIQPYTSTDNASRTRRTKVYGKKIEHMLELPSGGLKTFQKSKMLVVAPDKSGLIDAIRGVKIGDDPLEAIFPIADYTSTEDWHYVGSFGLNNLKQEPIIGLVANCDMAVDIAMKDPSYKLLVVDSASKLRAHYGSIERLNSDTNPRKVLCLLRSADEDELKTLHSMGIESYVWKRGDFKGIDTASYLQENPNEPFDKHSQIVSYLAGEEPEFREISLPTDIEKQVEESYRILYSLSKQVSPLPESGILIRWGISLINGWLQLPFTIYDFHEYIAKYNIPTKRMDEKYSDFKNRIRESYGLLIPAMHSSMCEELISKMDTLYEYFSKHSPKSEAILALLETNTNDATYVYCCSPQYTAAFNKLRGNKRIQAKNIEQLSSMPVKRGIITGWSNRRNAAQGFLAPVKNPVFILYRKELESLQRVYKTHPSSPESSYDKVARQSLGGVDTTSSVTLSDSEEGQSIESILEYITQKFNTPLYPNYDSSYNGTEQEGVEARQIQFDDGTMVYADAQHKFDKLERSKHKILRSKTIEISEGDELVFADSERSMFEELLSILKESEEYRSVAATANIWRDALQKYVESSNSSDQELAGMFRLVGCPRTIHTIRSWLSGNVIGPSNDNYAAIEAIARITKDQALIANRDEVIRACKTLHALHVKTGWLLVRNIINSAIEPDDSDVNEETRERLQAYSGSSRIAIVKSISEQTFSVPVSEIGRLNEGFS
ncbi:MAG TPA: DrmE family protein [Verrucomicrobiae bacterium]|nr:DrmE family protein [Verrucomicrobiae bacterium]